MAPAQYRGFFSGYYTDADKVKWGWECPAPDIPSKTVGAVIGKVMSVLYVLGMLIVS